MAILFGSAVAGSQGPESDIDIAIDIDRSLEIGDYLALLAELAEATGRPVDLVDLAKVGEPLLGQIITHGRQILGERQRFAQMLTRHLMDEADFLSYRNRILRERRQAWIGK
jgi:predicted nucleotidyltransferase